MLLVLMILPWAAAPAQAAPQASPRIVGGIPTTVAANPWQVLLINQNSLCGGSLIASTWILTAAHCMKGADPSRVQAWAGITSMAQRSEANRLPVSAVIVHPGYDPKSFANDVALVQLAGPWTPGPDVEAIALPVNQDATTWPAAGAAATISGWGFTANKGPAPAEMQRATVHILTGPGGDCGAYGTTFKPVTHVCAGEWTGGIDTCQGDSGGPLVIDVDGVPVLAGVTSVGNECALPNYPGLYSRVTTFVPWISETAGIPLTPPPVPEAVTVTAIAGARAVLSWTPSDADSYLVTSAPDSLTCTAPEPTCVVEGLKPGVAYSFGVQAQNAAGLSASSAATSPIIAVDGVSAIGATVKVSKVLAWSGLPPVPGPTLSSKTPARCKVVARGVLLKRAGVCRITVRSGAARGVALILAQ